MFIRDNLWKIILFGSLGIMSFVFLITSSIWMDFFNQSLTSAAAQIESTQTGIKGIDDALQTSKILAIISVAFVVLGIVTLVGAAFSVKKNGVDKNVLLIVIAAFVLLLIGVAVPMNDQLETYQSYKTSLGVLKNTPSNYTGMSVADLIPSYIKNASNVFPVALTFLLVPGLAFVGSSVMVANKELLF